MASFDKNPAAFGFWEKFPRSVKRAILEWIYSAKRDDTKAGRSAKTVEKVEQDIRADQYRQPKKK